VQHEGQLLYVPEHWFHAVVNVDDVVAISMQNVSKHTAELRLVQAKDLETLKAATERYPMRADVFFTYARALLKADKKANCGTAIPEFQKALELDSRFVLARVELAKCVEVIEGPQEAAEELLRALNLNPFSFSTRREIAMLLTRWPDHDFTKAPGMEDWSKDKWVVGPFEDVYQMIKANLDLQQLTS